MAHSLLGHIALAELGHAEIEADQHRSQHGEFNRRNTALVTAESREQTAPHHSGSFRNAVAAVSMAVPSFRRDRPWDRKVVISVCRYQTRTRIRSPGAPLL